MEMGVPMRILLSAFYILSFAPVRYGVDTQPHVDLTFSSDDSRYQQGKAKLMELRGQSSHVRYGPCWTEALKSLEVGCRQLTEDVQHELALKFAGCFLLKTGRAVDACDEDDKLACTRRMSPEVFNAYTEFFTHTQSICFYLQASEWQISTEETIDRLTDSSAHVAEQLGKADELQQELLRQQNDSIRNQQQLLEGGTELRQTLEESKVDVRAMMMELQKSTSEQRNMISEVFDRVHALQSIVLGEFTGFYSLIFYALAIVIAYLLTSTPRTSGARFWIFSILTINIAIEWTISKWHDFSDQLDPITGHPIDENTLLFCRLRTCRKCFVTLGIAIWCWVAYRYQDLMTVNNRLLVDIKLQNTELKTLLQSSGLSTIHSSSALDYTDAVVSPTERVKLDKDSSTGYNTVNTRADTSDEAVDNVSSSSTYPPMSHCINTDVEVLPALPVNLQHHEIDSHSGVSLPSLASETSASTSRQPRHSRAERTSVSLMDQSAMSSSNRYNLRSRMSSPAASSQFTSESAGRAGDGDNLSAEVNRLASITRRNRAKVLRTVQRAAANQSASRPDLFSSDEG